MLDMNINFEDLEKNKENVKASQQNVSFYHSEISNFDRENLTNIVFYNNKYHCLYLEKDSNKLFELTSSNLLNCESSEVELSETLEISSIKLGSLIDTHEGVLLFYTQKVGEISEISIGKIGDKKIDILYKNIIDKNKLVDVDLSKLNNPFAFKLNNFYYLLIGTSDTTQNLGKILVFKSKDLRKFDCVFEIGPFETFGKSVENPSYCLTSGKDVIFYTSVFYKENKIIKENNYMILNIDFEELNFSVLKVGKIDINSDLLIPKFFLDSALNPSMIGLIKGDKFLLSYPRKIVIEKDKFIQKPSKSIQKIMNKRNVYNENRLLSHNSLVAINAEGDFKLDFLNIHNEEIISILFNEGRLYFKNKDKVVSSNSKYNDLTLFMFIDRFSIEIFINHGVETFTSEVDFNDDKFFIKVLNSKSIKSMSYNGLRDVSNE